MRTAAFTTLGRIMPRAKGAKSRRSNESPATKSSEIAPGVYVGGWKEAISFTGARFCVLGERPEGMPSGSQVRIRDGSSGQADPQRLDHLAKAMYAARNRGAQVLVFCAHGARRSPLGTAWYLRRTEGLSLEDAYDRVRAVRPRIEHAREWVGNAEELGHA